MLPTKLRNSVFDKISGVTMRKFFHPSSLTGAQGLIKEVMLQSQRDFFINGTITSHAACPPLMAGMWMGGREIALTNYHLPAWLKKAMGAALSEVNKCPYCEDFLLSLTHGAKKNNVANSLRKNEMDSINDEATLQRLQWTKASITRNAAELDDPPFRPEELPEALGTLIVFNYTNKISDFTLNGSPVPSSLRSGALKFFGMELQESSALELEHGASLDLLPKATLPEEFHWAASNTLVAESLSRWNHVVEEEIDHALSEEAQQIIRNNLSRWQGGQTPLSRKWVEEEVQDLQGEERDKARLVLLIAKASYQIDDGVIEQVVHHRVNEADLVRLGAWGAFLGAKTIANWCWEASEFLFARQTSFVKKPSLVG
ncbi:MAG: hypothetical protein JSU60_06080 [Nitrospirota bacterium]|nr:MAG: hypothetical protein JSU60_06080 [Nitrospirota bacterium]